MAPNSPNVINWNTVNFIYWYTSEDYNELTTFSNIKRIEGLCLCRI